MSDINIFRPATEAEKENFIEIGTANALDIVLSKIATKQQEFIKKYQPFCGRCAKLDFEKNVRNVIEENTVSVDNEREKADTVQLEDLDKYASRDRYEFIESLDVKEDKLLDGMRTSTSVGKKYIFKCKIRGCGHTLFVPTEDLDKIELWLNGPKVEEPDEPVKPELVSEVNEQS